MNKYGRLTREEYYSLTQEGMEQADYWQKYLPTMYNEMADEGSLLERLRMRGERLHEEMQDLMGQGLNELEAREFIKQTIYELPPETKKRAPRRTKQEKAQDEVYEAAMEAMRLLNK